MVNGRVDEPADGVIVWPTDEIAGNFSAYVADAGCRDFHFPANGTKPGLQGGDPGPGKPTQSAGCFHRAKTAGRTFSVDASGVRSKNKRLAGESRVAGVAAGRERSNALRFSRCVRNKDRGR